MSRSNGTLYRVVGGRMVKASDVRPGDGMDVDYYDHKHGRRSRWLQRDMASAESIGRISTRVAVRMSRKHTAA